MYTLRPNELAQVQTPKERRNTEESAPPQVRLYQRCRHLGNLTKMARLPCCRDVTVCVSSSSGFALLLRRAAERWQDMHRCGVYAFDASGVI